MNDTADPEPDHVDDSDDAMLDVAGARLRSGVGPLDASGVEVAALRRRARRRGVAAGVAAVVAVVALVGAAATGLTRSDHDEVVAGNSSGVDRIVSSLGAAPIDPTRVKLVSTLETFGTCDALVGELRRVGAEHVGSRGFGADGMFSYAGASGYLPGTADAVSNKAAAIADSGSEQAGGVTLGTNVQVSGVDELDSVKADGKWIYDLDGKGNLRITDAATLATVATLRLVPPHSQSDGAPMPRPTQSLQSLLEHDGRIAVFGTKTVESKPVEGDPSATRSATDYLTVTFVDATEVTKPRITDQVQVEGALVSARLVKGQIRLVTTSDLADLGFVMPTSPTSVSKALDRNRRSVAASTEADWIPDWQRSGGAARPLVPCDRVHVPATFAGVAMTSLVSFPIGTGRFAPQATSIVAPGETLYAGLDTVAVSAQVWVDPIDRAKLRFDDWKTAIHEFSFADKGAPTYDGSGIVAGSTVGQFAFGEVGDALGVVTTQGTPWDQDSKNAVELTLLASDGDHRLTEVAHIDDLAGGKGSVSAVRFTPGRILVSTGVLGNLIRVIDVDDPAHPRSAGTVTVPGTTGYFHPLTGHRALLVGSRTDVVEVAGRTTGRNWVDAHLLDVADPDHPRIVGSWETPWADDQVASDHHAFTYWPGVDLAMWGVSSARFGSSDPNHAVILAVGGGLTQKAFPEAAKPPATPAPCPVVPVDDAEVRRMIGDGTIVLACSGPSRPTVEWPRYSCTKVDRSMLQRYAPDQVGKAAVFLCNLAPQPAVARVLVVDGRPILMTDQTLEALDPTTFVSRQVVFHPSPPGGYIGGFIE